MNEAINNLESSSIGGLTGFNCLYCGMWALAGAPHACYVYVNNGPAVQQTWPPVGLVGVLSEIRDALREIRDKLPQP